MSDPGTATPCITCHGPGTEHNIKAHGQCPSCYQRDYAAARAGRPVARLATSGRADILGHPDGPTVRELDLWVRTGLLNPQLVGSEAKPSWVWSASEARVAVDLARLVRAGLRPAVAETVARHPRGGPVVLAPGIVISLFDSTSSRRDPASVETEGNSSNEHDPSGPVAHHANEPAQ